MNFINWYGGKNKMANKIINIMPRHKIYVEVFGGGANILLNKKRSNMEVYNDINRGLVNLFSVVRDENLARRFKEKLDVTLYSREEFNDCKYRYNGEIEELYSEYQKLDKLLEKSEITLEEFLSKKKQLDLELEDKKVEVARMFYVLCQQSFSGTLDSWATDTSVKGSLPIRVKKFLNGVEGLDEITARMKTVIIENLDFEKLIEKYDSADTLFYLDPPYIHDTRGKTAKDVYEYELTNDLHVKLVEVLKGIKGKFILSGYNHPIYNPLSEGKFKMIKLGDFAKSCELTKEGEKKGVGEEYLWINYPL